MINIRLVQETDAQQLFDLACMFNATSHPDSREDVADYLRNTNDIVCVAEDAGVLIGFCCGRLNAHLSFKQPIVDITELFVKADHREKGIGKLLLSYMEAEFLKRGINRIRILVEKSNETARKFYVARGYAEFDMMMCRKDI